MIEIAILCNLSKHTRIDRWQFKMKPFGTYKQSPKLPSADDVNHKSNTQKWIIQNGIWTKAISLIRLDVCFATFIQTSWISFRCGCQPTYCVNSNELPFSNALRAFVLEESRKKYKHTNILKVNIFVFQCFFKWYLCRRKINSYCKHCHGYFWQF